MPDGNPITTTLETAIAGAIQDRRFRALLAGKLTRPELLTFARHFIVTHLNSVQVLSFLHALAPPDASDLVRENLLEEMGLEEAGQPHPDLLLDLARGLGFSEPEIGRLLAEAQEERRRFAGATIAYPALRELGLSILLETLTFEAFLSRVSDRLAESLARHYGLSAQAVRWFTLHGEVDVRHAEEGKRVVERYIAFHRFTPEELDVVVRKTFAGNVLLDRYFPAQATPSGRRRRSTVASVDIFALSIPFKRGFGHAKAVRSASDAVVVRVTGKDGSRGYGEALPRPYVTGEDVQSMIATLSGKLVPHVLNRPFSAGTPVLVDLVGLWEAWRRAQPPTAGVAAWNATRCAVELALLDWAFHRAGQSLSDWLVPVRTEVVYAGVIDATAPREAAAMAERYAAAKIGTLKVKVGVGDDVRRLAAIREAVGAGMRLRVDANGAWDSAQAVAALQTLQGFGVEAVEQPVAAADLVGMRQVREETGLPVIADESLLTLDDARRLVEERACDVFNIRVSKCGGLMASLAIAELGLASGVKLQVGAQVGETSLLSAAGRHLAAHLRHVEYVEGSFGTHLLTRDIAAEPVMFGYEGRGGLLLGYGLGVKVDDQALEKFAAQKLHLEG